MNSACRVEKCTVYDKVLMSLIVTYSFFIVVVHEKCQQHW